MEEVVDQLQWKK